jgi:hypothetical protein
MEKYRFDRQKHLHQLLVDGEYKNLTGCTTVLAVLAKPALIPWAAKMTVEYIRENCKKDFFPVPEGEEPGYYNYSVSEEQLEQAKKAHAKRKTDAGTYGTETHNEISLLIEDAIKNNGGYIKESLNLINKSIINFGEWAVKNKVKFLETEKNIYSEKLWVGGICDVVCEIDGEVWIGDIKTSGSGIYAEHFFQCAGYNIMMEEMGLYPNIKGYLILNLKENGEILEKRSISNEENKKIFINCLEIYRVMEKLKNNIIQ